MGWLALAAVVGLLALFIAWTLVSAAALALEEETRQWSAWEPHDDDEAA